MTIEALDLQKTADRAAKPSPLDWIPGAFALRDAWFPVAHLLHLSSRPVRRLVHSQPYFLWREDGRVRATEFHPEHLQSQLKNASEFTGGTGEYKVVERYGYAWVWYGNPASADAALIPDVPYLPIEGGLPRYMCHTTRFDSCAELSLENLLDLTHADFLHANVVGDELSDDDRIEVLSTSESVTMIRSCKNKSTAPVMKYAGVRAKTQDVRAVIHVHLRSSVAITCGTYTPGFQVKLFHPCVPESRYRNRLNYTFNTTGLPIPFRYMMPVSGFIVSPQDNSVVRPQAPRYAEPTERRDLHSRFDGAGVRYRFLMQQLVERQKRGDFAYQADGDPGRDVAALLGVKRVN